MRHEPHTEADDAEIIAASLDDEEVFGELFRRHSSRLHAYIKRRLGPTLADDIVAETFYIAFRRRGQYNARWQAGAWLWGIASNLIKKHYRQETRMYKAYAKTGVDPAEDGVAETASDRAAASALGPHLARALAGLRPVDRDALLLLAWGQMSYAEIAETLNLPLGTVKAKIHRARGKIRDALPEGGHDG